MITQHGRTPANTVVNGVYDRIKARVLENQFPPGKRIPIDELARDFIVSATPIRESLIRLACEQLVDEIPKAGFFAKEISESEVSDLYELQLMVLERSLRTIGRIGKTPGILKPPNLVEALSREKGMRSETVVHVMNELFIHIAKQSGRTSFVHLVCNINDRTHFVRSKDHEIFGDSDEMLLGLCRAYHAKEFAELSGDLGLFICQRLDRLPDLFRVLRGARLKDSA